MTLSIYQAQQNELVIKKSRFICHLLPITSEDDAKLQLTQLKQQTPQATHHCFAYIDKHTVHMSDDGEPSGTAGRPILSVLQSKQLTNVLAVVIRYFGGIKLGTGGLSRAYRQSVTDTLQKATLATLQAQQELNTTVNYSQWQALQHFLPVTMIKKVTYDINVKVTLLCEPQQIITYQRQINNLLHTQLTFQTGPISQVLIPLKNGLMK
ncbi:MAG: YigZ family protein [Candidatus Paralactobacillus gallistercoris]|uniref:YigZ family protein n=1 Tax=Candidatus Paralactobacillus gallistercoris TaxID=2838724 RepID=A0A948X0U8_9LACO|nr:YigZ family protein [Candidatus Paralactobacillus gallistercoris]